MKKIFFGLFVTVFSIASFSAKDIVDNDAQRNRECVKDLFFECRTSTITNYVDQNGNLFKTEQSSWQTIPCGNAPDGTNVIKSEIKVVERLETTPNTPSTDINP